MLAVLAVLTGLAIVFVRWVLILRFGHDTPFWDQWDSEIALLYVPYVNGDLTLSQWFAPHNEHRILFSRLFNLTLFELNGRQFDNHVETYANVILYTLTLLLCAWPVVKRLTGAALLLAFSMVFVIGVVPYGWENLLCGFQNAFSFLTALSVGAFAAAALGRGNLALGAALVLSFAALFTLGAGLAVAAVLIVVIALRWKSGEIPQRAALITMAIAAAIVAYGLWLAPSMAQDPTTPRTVARVTGVLSSLLGWPLPQTPLLGALVVWWPCVVTLWRRLAGRSRGDGLDLYLLAICGWVVLQCLAIAYSRIDPPNTVASRYTDVLILGVFANLVLAIRLIDPAIGIARRRVALAALLVLTVIGGGGLAISAMRSVGAMFAFHEITRETEINLHAYLSGQGAAAFADKHPLYLSYPLPDRLITLLEDPVVRNMMPSSIRPPLATTIESCTGFEPNGLFPTTPARSEAYGSYGSYVTNVGNPSVGRCTSATFVSNTQYLRFSVAGYLGKPGLSLRLVAGDRSVDVIPPFEARETWQPVVVAVPGSPMRWIATDENPEFWFAVTPPTEMGRLTHLVQRLTSMLSGAVKRDR